MAPQATDNHGPSVPAKARTALFLPLPDRWRPFSAFLGGAIIFIVVTIFGGYGGTAFWFFAAFTAFGAVCGIVWSLMRFTRRVAKTAV